jgi:uncharacterized delta-60 repeat protein
MRGIIGRLVAVAPVLVAFFVSSSAAGALPPGSLDPSFGTGGLVDAGTGTGPNLAVAVDDAGRIVTSALHESGALTDPSTVTLTRRLPDGAVDTAFGSAGSVVVHLPIVPMGGALAVTPEADVVLALSTSSGWSVRKFTADGRPDPAFGAFPGHTSGVGTVAFPSVEPVRGLAVAPAGDIYVLAAATEGDEVLTHLEADGAPDVGFGTDRPGTDPGSRRMELQGTTVASLASAHAEELVRRADGSLLLVGQYAPTAPHDTRSTGVVSAYDSTGKPLTGYGVSGAGVAIVPSIDRPSALVQAPDGGTIVLGPGGLARLDADGVFDRSFGDHGLARFPVPGEQTDADLVSPLALPDGSIVAAGAADPRPQPTEAGASLDPRPPAGLVVQDVRSPSMPNPRGAMQARFTPTGRLDCGYGGSGWITARLPGAAGGSASQAALAHDGAVVAVGDTGTGGGLLLQTVTGIADAAPLPPRVVTGGVERYTGGPAAVHGWVDPRCRDATWHVEYGRTGALSRRTPEVRMGGGDGPTEVFATLRATNQGTYRYRLVARTAIGTSVGATGTYVLRRYPGTLTVVSHRATARAGAAGVLVRCRRASCHRMEIRLVRRGTTVARGPVGLASGARGRVAVRLTPAGRRLVRRHATVATTLMAIGPGGTSGERVVGAADVALTLRR